jgi:molybdate transport system substrate-binding protein
MLTGFATASKQPQITLTVFAAASLTEAFREISQQVEAQHPGVRLRLNFAGSQQLAAQLQQAASADLFASADQHWIDFAKQAELLSGEPVVFAHNRLVVILPRRNPGHIGHLGDLARPGIKVVIGTEAVPVGAYARQVVRNLARAAGDRNYARRVLANVVSEEDNARSVVAKVQLGEADAGFVYQSDLSPNLERRLRALSIPDSLNVVATYSIAVVRGSHQPNLAQAFVGDVMSGTGQAILERWGFLPVASRP